MKKVARELLEILNAEKLVLDWRSRQQSRAAVRQLTEIELDKLPDPYTPEIFEVSAITPTGTFTTTTSALERAFMNWVLRGGSRQIRRSAARCPYQSPHPAGMNL